MTFGDWLLTTLEYKGWTQAELARRSDVTGTQISRIISGQRKPGVGSLRGISRALEMPLDDVLRRVDGAPVRMVRDSRRVIYEIDGDQVLLAKFHAMNTADQDLVRGLIERLTDCAEPRIIGDETG
jgi:transcriptional regulator with XRE-family HTH domain